MRTGPFSEPSLVHLINRYFIAYHFDNDAWTEPRYGINPGEENAYIVMETPDIPGLEKDIVILDRLPQVLQPENTYRELVAFLEKHPQLHQPWPELVQLEKETSHQSRLRRAELLLEEGKTQAAMNILRDPALPEHAALLRARAYRLEGKLDEAEVEITRLAESPPLKLAEDIELERIRIAFAKGEHAEAAAQLDAFLSPRLKPSNAAEAHWMRGWLHYLSGSHDRAIDVWTQGIDRYPPHKALYSQKAYFTMIRANWELPDNVDQPY